MRWAARSKSRAAQGVPGRFLCEVVALAPLAGALVKKWDQVRLLGEQVCPQYVGEKVVVAVPLPSIVQGHEKKVGALQGDEQPAAVVAAGDGVTKRPGEPVENRRVQQEFANRVGLSLQHLLDEIVDDVPVVPGELGDESTDVRPTLHRDRGELKRSDPAFGPALQRGDVIRGEVQAGDVVEVGGNFVGGEAQVGGADLDQFTAGPEPRQRQQRVGSAADHQVNVRWEVLEQERHAVAEVGPVDQVVVVEHQDHLIRCG